jgi:hypothetical protein
MRCPAEKSADATMSAMPSTHGDGPPENHLPITLVGYWEGDLEPGWPRITDFVD